MKNMAITPVLTHFVRVHQMNIHTKFEANPCIGLIKRSQKVILYSDICNYQEAH